MGRNKTAKISDKELATLREAKELLMNKGRDALPKDYEYTELTDGVIIEIGCKLLIDLLKGKIRTSRK
jgi:hypothetical protein